MKKIKMRISNIFNNYFNLIEIVRGALVMLGFVLLVLSCIISVIGFFQLWGRGDISLSTSFWIVFIFWLKMICFGLFCIFVGSIRSFKIKISNENKDVYYER